ncbi:hypothetical protein OIU76_021484 [Salix suchowensis]|nr:hypothetical protein OIU76_021484 [Salix suchowensis]
MDYMHLSLNPSLQNEIPKDNLGLPEKGIDRMPRPEKGNLWQTPFPGDEVKGSTKKIETIPELIVLFFLAYKKRVSLRSLKELRF